MSDPVYLMVIAPHPDDPEFGIGGTVARIASEGKKVVYVICTNGDKGTSDRSLTPDTLAITRQQEQRNAAAVLGVREVVFLGYPDQGIEDTSDFRKELVRQIRTFRPEVVATCDPYRKYIWHRDHRITGQVVLDAVFPYARDHLAFEDLLASGLETHKVSELWFWGTEDINFKVDITDTIDVKFEALACHKTQVGDLTSEMRNRLQEFARLTAENETYQFAEGFHKVEIRR